jgi:acyl carrier protein
MSTEQAVIQVIAEVKHIDPDNIALSDKLSELQFDHAGRRDLANEINEFFQHRLNMVFDTLMHPSETDADQTVGEVIQKVKAKHPRPRTPIEVS